MNCREEGELEIQHEMKQHGAVDYEGPLLPETKAAKRGAMRLTWTTSASMSRSLHLERRGGAKTEERVDGGGMDMARAISAAAAAVFLL
jgi:hypothetical protein